MVALLPGKLKVPEVGICVDAAVEAEPKRLGECWEEARLSLHWLERLASGTRFLRDVLWALAESLAFSVRLVEWLIIGLQACNSRRFKGVKKACSFFAAEMP